MQCYFKQAFDETPLIGAAGVLFNRALLAEHCDYLCTALPSVAATESVPAAVLPPILLPAAAAAAAAVDVATVTARSYNPSEQTSKTSASGRRAAERPVTLVTSDERNSN